MKRSCSEDYELLLRQRRVFVNLGNLVVILSVLFHSPRLRG